MKKPIELTHDEENNLIATTGEIVKISFPKKWTYEESRGMFAFVIKYHTPKNRCVERRFIVDPSDESGVYLIKDFGLDPLNYHPFNFIGMSVMVCAEYYECGQTSIVAIDTIK